MNVSRLTRSVLALAALVACGTTASVAASILIPDRYELHELSAPDAAKEIAQCVIGANAEGVEKFVKDQSDPKLPGRQAQFAIERSSGAVITANGRWACVRFSQDGFPLWPLETLRSTIVPVGVPADQVAVWRRNMLENVAREGVARGLIVYPNGAATQVNVIAEMRQALTVKFTTRYLKAGDYDAAKFNAVLSDPGIQSVVTESSGSGTPSRFAIPPALLRKAVEGEYVALKGTDATGSFEFAGSKWKFASGGSELWIQPQGLVIFSSKRSSDNGTWSVDNGVLHVALAGGARYAMWLDAEKRALVGEGRRTTKPTHEEDDGERHWSFKLDRQ